MLQTPDFHVTHVQDRDGANLETEIDYWALDEYTSDTTATMGENCADGTPGFWVDVCVDDAYYISARDLPSLDAAMSFAMSCIAEFATSI